MVGKPLDQNIKSIKTQTAYHIMTSVTKQGPLEQTVAKYSRIFMRIRISNELSKITLECKADQTEIVRYLEFIAQYFGHCLVSRQN